MAACTSIRPCPGRCSVPSPFSSTPVSPEREVLFVLLRPPPGLQEGRTCTGGLPPPPSPTPQSQLQVCRLPLALGKPLSLLCECPWPCLPLLPWHLGRGATEAQPGFLPSTPVPGGGQHKAKPYLCDWETFWVTPMARPISPALLLAWEVGPMRHFPWLCSGNSARLSPPGCCLWPLRTLCFSAGLCQADTLSPASLRTLMMPEAWFCLFFLQRLVILSVMLPCKVSPEPRRQAGEASHSCVQAYGLAPRAPCLAGCAFRHPCGRAAVWGAQPPVGTWVRTSGSESLVGQWAKGRADSCQGLEHWPEPPSGAQVRTRTCSQPWAGEGLRLLRSPALRHGA